MFYKSEETSFYLFFLFLVICKINNALLGWRRFSTLFKSLMHSGLNLSFCIHPRPEVDGHFLFVSCLRGSCLYPKGNNTIDMQWNLEMQLVSSEWLIDIIRESGTCSCLSFPVPWMLTKSLCFDSRRNLFAFPFLILVHASVVLIFVAPLNIYACFLC